ncbi:MAG: efflux transporter outer membrane subunit [Oligoflexia bacterium]|nr:efflux transporter outer membrane subunit [Oligoflexia bacterium]
MKNIRILALFFIYCGAVLQGCTVGPDFVRPEPPKETQYTHGDEPSKTQSGAGTVQSFEVGAKVPENWWRLFHPSKLDPVVASVLKRNSALQAALASLRQSQQSVFAGEGVFYPQVNAAFGASRERSNPISVGVNVPPSIFNLLTLSGSVSYALDLFGGNRRAVEGLQAQADYQRYTVLATYLTLTGNAMNAVIARAAYQAEIEATQEVVRAEKEQVALTQANVSGGTAAESVLLSLKSQLAATEATLPPLALKFNQTEHLLAVLSGETPVQWTSPQIAFSDIKLPESLPKTLPSELVRQRPDILQSEAQLHAACAQVGVATAALFPSFTLGANAGIANTSAGSLFSTGSSFWSFGADITAPLFRGGTLSAQKQAAVEGFQAALANYRQTVLAGFQQVADALRALEHDAELVRAQSDVLESAEEALALVQANYKAGTAGYLQLLTADTQYFQAKIGFLQGSAQRLQDTVALFIALGGGWWNLPSGDIQQVGKQAP